MTPDNSSVEQEQGRKRDVPKGFAGQSVHYESPDYAGPAQTVPYDSREKKTDDVHLSAVESPKEPACQGLTLEHLALKTQNCGALEDGICRVVADSQHRKATAVAGM
jgi:hypothetical protein